MILVFKGDTLKQQLDAAKQQLDRLGFTFKTVELCERGIRTFETHTRNTLDLNAVAALKTMTPLPVLVDPSHGTGRRELVRATSRAAIAAGADGLLIEVHQQPDAALSDGEQAITPSMLKEIVGDARRIRAALSDAPSFATPAQAAVPSVG